MKTIHIFFKYGKILDKLSFQTLAKKQHASALCITSVSTPERHPHGSRVCTHRPVLWSSGPAWCAASFGASPELGADPLGNTGIFLFSCISQKKKTTTRTHLSESCFKEAKIASSLKGT